MKFGEKQGTISQINFTRMWSTGVNHTTESNIKGVHWSHNVAVCVIINHWRAHNASNGDILYFQVRNANKAQVSTSSQKF